MVTKRDEQAQQLSLDEVLKALDEQPGELLKLPIYPDDIGASLLHILSKGLYTNPLDCIREYVQNGVDADASEITIKISGNSVIIFDNGVGMDIEQLVQARQFGLSDKSLEDYVGFRGIGIYSGFDLCRKLHITSTKADDPHLYVLVFDFAAMKKELEASKGTDARKPSLLELLSKHTAVKQEFSTFPQDQHFTKVELMGIGDVPIRQLSDRTKLKRYLLQNLPVDFSDDFEHKKQITEMLNTYVRGYRAVKILLQSDNLEDEIVVKEAIGGLQEPRFHHIKTSSGREVAFCWSCLTSERERLFSTDRRNKGLVGETNPEGFVYKVKGFTIGDRDKLQRMFTKAHLYRWYTGEIYILDPEVIPNTERDDFETNQAKEALELEVSRKLRELEGDAGKFQAVGVADKRIAEYANDVAEIADQVESNTQEDDLFETWSRLEDIRTGLNKHKGNASAEKRLQAKELVDRVKGLQKQVREYIDKPKPRAARNKRAARRNGKGDTSGGKAESRPPVPKTLRIVLQDAGWELEDEMLRLVELIQESLEDVLTIDSSVYRSLMDDLEGRITAANANE